MIQGGQEGPTAQEQPAQTRNESTQTTDAKIHARLEGGLHRIASQLASFLLQSRSYMQNATHPYTEILIVIPRSVEPLLTLAAPRAPDTLSDFWPLTFGGAQHEAHPAKRVSSCRVVDHA